MNNEPGFNIPHPGLNRVFNHARTISPILNTDRYTVPEYQELLRFITSGELWNMMLEDMSTQYLNVEIPQEYK
jgi:hypothetical protein